MLKPYCFRTVNGLLHLVMTAHEWENGLPDHSGVVSDSYWTGWPVGTKTALYYDEKHGTCLAPVIIEG